MMKFKHSIAAVMLAAMPFIHLQAQTLTAGGSTEDIVWETCEDVPTNQKFHFTGPSNFEDQVTEDIYFTYNITLMVGNNSVAFKLYQSSDAEMECDDGAPCPEITAEFVINDPPGGDYRIHLIVDKHGDGLFIENMIDEYSNTIHVSRPDDGTFTACTGDQNANAKSDCKDEIKVYSFEPGIDLVVFKDEGLIIKAKNSGTGLKMYGIGGFGYSTGEPIVNQFSENAPNFIGYQKFEESITDVDYSSDGKLLIGFKDGKVLKIHGLGGSGQNMFGITESSDDFGNAGYPYYCGHHKFKNAITDITCVGDYTLVSTSGEKMLKVNGSGGSGANVFAIEENSNGFTGVPGYSYFVGSAHFDSDVIAVYMAGTSTFIAFDNNKLLKVVGSGGSGQNFLAVEETPGGFTGIPGYFYYIGAAKFETIVTDLMYAEGTTTIGFKNGKLLKVKDTGGGGLNMFAIEETSDGFDGFDGYDYYMGHAHYSHRVQNILYAGGHTFITFEDGKLLKVKDVGGTGANMYNATEGSLGFYTTSTSYSEWVEGSSFYNTKPTDLKLINDQIYICCENQKMFKAKDYGGTGYNCFNVAQTGDGFQPLASYSTYVTGTQIFECQKGRSKSTRFEPTEEDETSSLSLITAYPNPVTENLTVSLPGEFSSMDAEVKTELYNLNGQLVYTSVVRSVGNIILPMAGLTPGMYLLRVNASDVILYSRKIIKQ